MTKFVQDFDVKEKTIEEFKNEFKNVIIVQKHVSDLDSENKVRWLPIIIIIIINNIFNF